jgi:hypothetical protein
MQYKSRFAFVVLALVLLSNSAYAQVTYYANFLTSDGVHYLCAESGGGSGSVLVADRTYPGAWETFPLTDTDGGSLLDGDHVIMRANSGHIIGGYCSSPSPAFADGRPGCLWANNLWHFWIYKVGGSGGNAIASGDQVILYYDSGWSLIADWGGGSTARIGGSWGPHETFTITY